MIITPKKWKPHIVCFSWRIFAKTLLFTTRLKYEVYDERSREYKEGLPKGLYIANHQSFMDIILLASQVQIPPIMKKEALYIPLFGLTAWLSGSIVVDRKDPDSRKKVFEISKDRLLKGHALQYYPEGTRSKNGSPKAFEDIKIPLMAFAYENNIPVFPVTMVNTNQVLSAKGQFNSKVTLKIKLAKEVYSKDFENAEGFSKSSWQNIQDNFEEMNLR